MSEMHVTLRGRSCGSATSNRFEIGQNIVTSTVFGEVGRGSGREGGGGHKPAGFDDPFLALHTRNRFLDGVVHVEEFFEVDHSQNIRDDALHPHQLNLAPFFLSLPRLVFSGLDPCSSATPNSMKYFVCSQSGSPNSQNAPPNV